MYVTPPFALGYAADSFRFPLCQVALAFAHDGLHVGLSIINLAFKPSAYPYN